MSGHGGSGGGERTEELCTEEVVLYYPDVVPHIDGILVGRR